MTRLPLEPVLALFPPLQQASENTTPGPLAALCRTVGVCRNTGWQWSHKGIPVEAADRIAVALGRHPAEIWGMEWWGVSA